MSSINKLPTLIVIIIVAFIFMYSYFVFKEKQKQLIDKGCCTYGIVYERTTGFKERNCRTSFKFTFHIDTFYGFMPNGYFDTLYNTNHNQVIGKKVKIKYVPEDPSNNTLVAWDEPCECDSLGLKKK